MEEMMIVLTTTSTLEDGKRLANTFVEEHLATCVNLIPINSVYPWEGAIQDDPEVLLVIKTASLKLHQLEERLHQIHPYAVPEFVAVESGHVADAYKAWLLNWLA